MKKYRNEFARVSNNNNNPSVPQIAVSDEGWAVAVSLIRIRLTLAFSSQGCGDSASLCREIWNFLSLFRRWNIERYSHFANCFLSPMLSYASWLISHRRRHEGGHQSIKGWIETENTSRDKWGKAGWIIKVNPVHNVRSWTEIDSRKVRVGFRISRFQRRWNVTRETERKKKPR